MKPFFCAALAALSVTGLPALSADLAEMTGIWRTVRHGALGEILDCGNQTPCGRLSWIDPAQSQGNTQDIRNRNPRLRDRPLIGVPVLYGFAPTNGGWEAGQLYNPDDGKTFDARMTLLSRDELQVTGCIGPLCRSQIWTRVK